MKSHLNLFLNLILSLIDLTSVILLFSINNISIDYITSSFVLDNLVYSFIKSSFPYNDQFTFYLIITILFFDLSQLLLDMKWRQVVNHQNRSHFMFFTLIILFMDLIKYYFKIFIELNILIFVKVGYLYAEGEFGNQIDTIFWAAILLIGLFLLNIGCSIFLAMNQLESPNNKFYDLGKILLLFVISFKLTVFLNTLPEFYPSFSPYKSQIYNVMQLLILFHIGGLIYFESKSQFMQKLQKSLFLKLNLDPKDYSISLSIIFLVILGYLVILVFQVLTISEFINDTSFIIEMTILIVIALFIHHFLAKIVNKWKKSRFLYSFIKGTLAVSLIIVLVLQLISCTNIYYNFKPQNTASIGQFYHITAEQNSSVSGYFSIDANLILGGKQPDYVQLRFNVLVFADYPSNNTIEITNCMNITQVTLGTSTILKMQDLFSFEYPLYQEPTFNIFFGSNYSFHGDEHLTLGILDSSGCYMVMMPAM